MNGNGKASAMRSGVVVIIVLAVLTAAEFLISAATNGSVVPLTIIALIKAGLILQYFMHAPRVLGSDGEGGSH
jgi:heme/copper-type cytochrome/quinol oxidase subunit 4